MEETRSQEDTDQKSNPESTPPKIVSEPQNPTNEEPRSSSDSSNSENDYKRKEYKLAVINAYVNAFIGLITALVFFLAFSQNHFIVESNDSNRKMAEEAKRTSDIALDQYKLSVQQINEASEEGRKRFKMDSINFQQQIYSFQEQIRIMKEQFKIENRPFLYVVVDYYNFLPDGRLEFTFKAVNLGKYPAKVFETSTYIGYVDQTARTHKESTVSEKRGYYVTKDFPSQTKIIWPYPFTEEEINFVKIGRSDILWEGKMKYESLVEPKKIKEFNFLITFQFNSGTVKYDRMDNIDL